MAFSFRKADVIEGIERRLLRSGEGLGKNVGSSGSRSKSKTKYETDVPILAKEAVVQNEGLAAAAVGNDILAPAGAAIEVSGVSKRFGANTVLNDLNISIEPGKFVAIVGRSGCGKSTLLRLIAGLDDTTAGTVKFDGQQLKGINRDARFMFQDARLLPWQTVIDNVKLGITEGNSKEKERKAYAALQQVGLEDRAKDWPSVLSGGQRQRVALARALVVHPNALLFDEPLGALDALTRIDMQRLIERLWEERTFTAILVTHDVSEAVALADRVILIEEGYVAMDIAITLSRPRVKDSGFAHFEKLILDRVLAPDRDAARRLDGCHFDI